MGRCRCLLLESLAIGLNIADLTARPPGGVIAAKVKLERELCREA
jgi:hypothetical protein